MHAGLWWIPDRAGWRLAGRLALEKDTFEAAFALSPTCSGASTPGRYLSPMRKPIEALFHAAEAGEA